MKQVFNSDAKCSVALSVSEETDDHFGLFRSDYIKYKKALLLCTGDAQGNV